MTNRIAIVTGASSGIGAATAMALARNGVWVLLVGRRAGELEKVRALIAGSGGGAACLAADITCEADRAGVVTAALAKSGRIDVLVNCAGVGQRGAVEMVPMERVKECFDVNVFAPAALIQYVAAIMRTQQSGHIVNISSMSGRIARPFSAVYDATKHALEALSDGLREELAPFGVHVTVIQPGYTTTNFSAAADARDAENGVYGVHARALRSRDWRRRFSATAEQVAEVVARAIASESPRTRYAVPRVVAIVLLLRRLLSDRIFYRLTLGPIPLIAKQ
ncbi:MAG TPA: SDR family NAD(P)-dependent oxidoreductase [Thermoanaerobaculia bacterium]